MSKRLALVTGASSGIGRETAVALAQAGWNLVLTARRTERLQELQARLGDAVKACLSFDVRNRQATETALNSLPEALRTPDLLVNNAGLALGLAPLDQGDPDHWEGMIDTNLKGLLWVSRVVVARMRQRGSGHVINVGSTAGKEPYPNGAVYCATKFGVDALTKALRMDVLGTGIRVGAVQPGMVETEFSLVRFDGDAGRAKKVYEGMTPLQPQDVAATIVWMAEAPPHMNVADVLLLPTHQASAMLVHRQPASGTT